MDHQALTFCEIVLLAAKFHLNNSDKNPNRHVCFVVKIAGFGSFSRPLFSKFNVFNENMKACYE